MKSMRAALVAGALLLAAACGGDDGSTAGSTSSNTASPPSTTSPSPSPSASDDSDDSDDSEGAGGVMVASTSLGEVLVGANGMTLYMFDPDQQGASTCYDQCAQAWPPLTVTGTPVAGEGVDDSLLGVVARDDGSEQATYGGWPLYYWASDAAPGDVTGQGVNDVWWVIDAEGQPVR